MIKLNNLQAPARTPAGVANAASIIGCDEAALRAIIKIETGSRGFDSSGRLAALFEPHVMYRQLAKNRPELVTAAQEGGWAYPGWGAQPYPKDSYPRIQAAARLDEELAYRATSWGLPQILGENFKKAGYASAIEMVTDFLRSEDNQIQAMATFIKNSPGMADALIRHDWATFAKLYNGTGYAKNAYDTRLAAAYAKEGSVPSSASAKSAIGVGSGAAAGGAIITHVQTGSDFWTAVLIGVAILLGLVFLAFALPKKRAVGATEAPIEPSAPLSLIDELREAQRAFAAAQERLSNASIAIADDIKEKQDILSQIPAQILLPPASATQPEGTH